MWRFKVCRNCAEIEDARLMPIMADGVGIGYFQKYFLAIYAGNKIFHNIKSYYTIWNY